MKRIAENGGTPQCEEAVAHHKKLWTQWWPLREQFELAPERSFPWTFSGSRPANRCV